ncbi:MAG: hypothetical protein ACREDO_02680 [Methyloceanibacter sp.]
MAIYGNSRWLRLAATVLLAAIVVATFLPAGWQLRLGLHWLLEHFIAYFSLTILLCLLWNRPLAVAAALIQVAVLLEAAQGLTPDRVPDPATALLAAAGISVAALLSDLVLNLRKAQASAASRPEAGR